MPRLWSPSIADTFCRPPPPMGFPTLAYGMGDSTLRRKILRVHLVPLNVGYAALQAMRAWYASAEGQRQYAHRAGIEGTLSQGVRAFGLRRTRFRGLAKTHLQHITTAAAINVDRIVAWL